MDPRNGKIRYIVLKYNWCFQMFICINYSLLNILHPLTVGSWNVALIVYSVCPMNCLIFQMNCSLSGLYFTVPVSLYYLFTCSTLKEGF